MVFDGIIRWFNNPRVLGIMRAVLLLAFAASYVPFVQGFAQGVLGFQLYKEVITVGLLAGLLGMFISIGSLTGRLSR